MWKLKKVKNQYSLYNYQFKNNIPGSREAFNQDWKYKKHPGHSFFLTSLKLGTFTYPYKIRMQFHFLKVSKRKLL
jgi:hypothetical protein